MTTRALGQRAREYARTSRLIHVRAGGALLLVLGAQPALGGEPSGDYGRMEGDIAASFETGVSGAFGEWAPEAPHATPSLALRAGLYYLLTAGAVVQYNDAFGLDGEPLARSLAAGIELRPLFLGRFAQDMERGPAYLDLLVDSLGLGLSVFRAWNNPRFCAAEPSPRGSVEPSTAPCHDVGVELSAGIELSLLPRASSPFVSVRAAGRWSMLDRGGAYAPPPPIALVTLSLGYHHLLEAHVVDAGDRSVR